MLLGVSFRDKVLPEIVVEILVQERAVHVEEDILNIL
jgi:hypothetical protein